MSVALVFNAGVPSAQQLLFPDPQPLVERLGRDFFRRLPECPGVYLMRDVNDAVLYVGKAKNLRKRLGSYRVANPDRMPRRHLRLLRAVERIELQTCSDEETALAYEAELLLALKPAFNRAGVWQGTKRFLGWRLQPDGLEVAVIEALTDGWHCTGPFGAQAVHVHHALVRLLWCRLHPASGLAGMPYGWVHGESGQRTVIPHSDAGMVGEALERLSHLASGAGEGFQRWLLPVTATFEQPLRDEDLEFVTEHLAGRPQIVGPAV